MFQHVCEDVYSLSLGLFYFVLGNLQPALRSKMKHIQLAAIATCGVMKKYGIDVVMKPILEDIKKLVRYTYYLTYMFHTDCC